MDSAQVLHLMLDGPEATRALGARLAAAAEPGDAICLVGPLGAGKTTLVDGFARAMGAAPARSPTFVLAHRYDGGRLRIWHLDLYRLDDPAQVADLDLAQYFEPGAVTLVEWADRAPHELPADALSIVLEVAPPGRRATLQASGPASLALLERLAAAHGRSEAAGMTTA
jgi:tRNA threonylcarbamoyladenosine biosynthesis protein TsaE